MHPNKKQLLINNASVKQAVAALSQGGVIAYPTEAVFGLGCDPSNQAAVMRLLRLKRRPVEKGLIIIAAEVPQLEPFIDLQSLSNRQTILASWPGPNTWVIPCNATTPKWLTGKHNSLAVRITAHPLAAALCRQFGSAIVSTSANKTAQAPALSYAEVLAQFENELDFIVPGATGGDAQVTTIRDALTEKILR